MSNKTVSEAFKDTTTRIVPMLRVIYILYVTQELFTEYHSNYSESQDSLIVYQHFNFYNLIPPETVFRAHGVLLQFVMYQRAVSREFSFLIMEEYSSLQNTVYLLVLCVTS